jgi:prepilin-type N-terminal cleavage/methylation domain-containing protein
MSAIGNRLAGRAMDGAPDLRVGSRRDLPRSTGFTLVELVVVMTVIGILAAALGPKLFTQTVFTDRSYADDVAGALRLTREAAVISGCPARLTLSATGYVASQQVAVGNACNTADTTWLNPVVSIDGTLLQASAPSATTATPTGIFQFDDQGRVSSSPGLTLTVGARTIVIDAGSGLVLVQ